MAEGDRDREPSTSSDSDKQSALMDEGAQSRVASALVGLAAGQSKCTSQDQWEFDEIPGPSSGQDGGNKYLLTCKLCKCKVMRPGRGTLVEKEFSLPNMAERHKVGTEPVSEMLSQFWLVKDMYHFENVGFSKTVGSSLKYLLCADCEVGPIGWHDLKNGQEFYVAASRVKYSNL